MFTDFLRRIWVIFVVNLSLIWLCTTGLVTGLLLFMFYVNSIHDAVFISGMLFIGLVLSFFILYFLIYLKIKIKRELVIRAERQLHERSLEFISDVDGSYCLVELGIDIFSFLIVEIVLVTLVFIASYFVSKFIMPGIFVYLEFI